MTCSETCAPHLHQHCSPECEEDCWACTARALPLHRTEAGYPHCSTCDGGGCPDCTDPA